MKSLPLLFLGIFFTLAFSWTGLILSTQIQLGDLEPATENYVDASGNPISGAVYEVEAGLGRTKWVEGQNAENEPLYPVALAGEAQRGRLVYEDLGCLYCHSQQVRRQGFGSDFERGWGKRQSVARDYILEERLMLGTMRTGPDLANVGDRYTELWHYQHLYNPQITSVGSIMPPFPFLFKVQKISDMRGPSPDAVTLPEAYALETGYELVPTQRGRDLVAYLMSLRQNYELPEMKFTE